jgi:hypothetical protein
MKATLLTVTTISISVTPDNRLRSSNSPSARTGDLEEEYRIGSQATQSQKN